MAHQKIKNLIRKTILESIKETVQDSSIDLAEGEILTKGAFVTGGRSKAFVADAKARAESDPKGLMSDLRITSPAAGSDLEKVQKILNAAIHGNAVMSQAYLGTRRDKDTPVGSDKERNVIAVNVAELDRKNGIRFLAHTLTAAKNAGYLSLNDSIQFSQGDKNSIIIYSVEQ